MCKPRWQRPAVTLPSPTACPEPIDPVRLQELRELEYEGVSGLVAELFDSFLTQADADVTTLGIAGERGDGALVGQVCHRLRGAAATLGALGVAGACEDLEAAVSAGEAPVNPALLQRLKSEVTRVAFSVEAWEAG